MNTIRLERQHTITPATQLIAIMHSNDEFDTSVMRLDHQLIDSLQLRVVVCADLLWLDIRHVD